MAPGGELQGWRAKVTQVWELLSYHKQKKMNWGRGCCFVFLLVLMFQDIIFEFDHGLYLRDSAFENKACNIYHLLVKVQKSPRRFTVLPMTPQPHIHTHPCTHTHTVLPSWTEENAQNYCICISYFIKYMDQTVPVPTETKRILNLSNATQIPQ